jgi:CelD/BcsL family acetyltransferase involved in cellulose biosynthesis
MQVQRITSWVELTALEMEWNTLATGMPLRSWDWLATWWKHYGGWNCGPSDNAVSRNRELCVLAVYREPTFKHGGPVRELIGIAPWYIDRSAVKGSVIRWLGDGEVCTDHLSLICRPMDAQQVAASLAKALTEQLDDWDRIELTAVDADDEPIRSLAAELANRECVIDTESADSVWILDVPSSWEEYLAAISKSHRKQLRQLQHRVLETPRVAWHYVESADQFDAGWEVLVDLHQRRRISLGESGCFASQAFRNFHCETARRLLGRGQLRLSWLELDGSPAAVEYHLADRTTVYAYQGGIDPHRLGDEPGRLSALRCLQQAIQEQCQRFDFLRGDEPYKAHWRATPHAVVNYRIVPNRRLARLRGHVMTFADTLNDWARNTAQLVTSG